MPLSGSSPRGRRTAGSVRLPRPVAGAVTVARETGELTVPSVGSRPRAVAALRTDPASTSSWVTV